MLLDAAFIQEKDAEFFNKKHPLKHSSEGVTLREALYTTQDVDSAMKLFVGLVNNGTTSILMCVFSTTMLAIS
jgi:hypothetical protein